jgi:Fe2+ or Zn2+ uptake regulation protein
MNVAPDQLRQTLKRHGQSLTRSRQAVFSALQGQEPQSMRAIVTACRGQADSDIFHRHHHHLTCLRCGRITPLKEDRQLENKLKTLAGNANFKIHDHQLEIQGICANCH